MSKFILFCYSFLMVSLCSGQLLSPNAFLPTAFGKQATPYHHVIEYFQYLAQSSKQITITQYGTTHQDRPLMLAFISSQENLEKLEQLRTENVDLAYGKIKNPSETLPSIVWVSMNVHGNEIGAVESSMQLAYELLDSENNTLFQNTIIILDPCLNPDGNARYSNWLRDISGEQLHPDYTDREHMEPWPTGRYNHYVYDLNRDWAWQTQRETQLRNKIYLSWLPHVHVDVHEMGVNEPYFFAPAAEPLHPFITQHQRSMQEKIGSDIANVFDQKNWLYYTRERFDLFYPSYGDTYPSFFGAVGMTYEQAGNTSAGRAIRIENGDTLTLQQRIDHHTAAVFSTIQTVSKRKSEFIKGFAQYFDTARNSPKGEFKSYLLKKNNRLKALADLLDKNAISYSYATTKSSLPTAYHYQSKGNKTATIEPGDMIIQAAQTHGTMLQVLMEPKQTLTDSITYDITAWALPLAYGIEAFAVSSMITVSTTATAPTMAMETLDPKAYGYVLPWNTTQSAQVLAQLHKANIKVRMAIKDVKQGINTFFRGTLLVTKADNPNFKNLDQYLSSLSTPENTWTNILTGFTNTGGDLGGSAWELLKKPKALTIVGEGTTPTQTGEIWHFFDQKMGYPLSKVEFNKFSRVNLSDYNTLILPDGWYRFSETDHNRISQWVQQGGKLILIEGPLSQFEEKPGFSLKKFATTEEEDQEEDAQKKKALSDRFESYENQERRYIKGNIPGAIVENKLDPTHPLAFGLGTTYYSLKTGAQYYKMLKQVWNVAYVPRDYKHFGFIGAEMKPKLSETVSFAVEEVGRGKAIYMVDNPLFRGFWETGNLLFANAVFLVK